jgi:hypothetical protein
MKEEIKLKDHTIWEGNYKNVAFKIVKWNREYTPETEKYNNGYHWNYYIFVKPRKLVMTRKLTTKEKYIYEPRVDYYKMYPDVEMHGGLTFWNGHMHSRTGKREVDEIGCDYGHLWDYEYEGSNKFKTHTVEEIMEDVKNTIDNLPEDLKFK